MKYVDLRKGTYYDPIKNKTYGCRIGLYGDDHFYLWIEDSNHEYPFVALNLKCYNELKAFCDKHDIKHIGTFGMFPYVTSNEEVYKLADVLDMEMRKKFDDDECADGICFDDTEEIILAFN